jgi:CCR4-NOT transcription complex subunit 4
MFLHEPGEDSESFTRQGLSSLNAGLTQHAPSEIPPSQSPQPQAPSLPPQPAQPVAAAAVAQDFDHAVSSPTESAGDGPALPATASWGDQARRLSRTTTVSANSPLAAVSVPLALTSDTKSDSKPAATAAAAAAAAEPLEQGDSSATEAPPAEIGNKKPKKSQNPHFDNLIKKAFDPNLKFKFRYPAHFTEQDRWVVEHMPPLFDLRQGARRRLIKEKEAEEMRQRQEEAEAKPVQLDDIDDPVEPAGGSSQLGGEPEERPPIRGFPSQLGPVLSQQAIGSSDAGFGLGQNAALSDDLSGLGAPGRAFTPQQTQQQLLLQQMKMAGNANHGQAAGHARQNSRFFLNEAMGTASKNLGKQLGHGQFANQGLGHFNYTSAQGPPPGLKTSGTPPVSGGGMFGQGHGFTPGLGYGPRENDKLWDAHGGRGAIGRPDAGKREFMFPYHQYPSTSGAPGSGVLSFPYGGQGGAYQEPGGPQKQKKKGKKHRHANTSSSGGGVVDVTDPSILQMRVGGIGQAAYGQGQGGFPSLQNNAYRW